MAEEGGLSLFGAKAMKLCHGFFFLCVFVKSFTLHVDPLINPYWHHQVAFAHTVGRRRKVSLFFFTSFQRRET